jgi:outer membrane protein TolC
LLSTTLTAILVAALPVCGPLDLDDALSLAAARSDEVAVRQAELAAAQVDVALARALRIAPSASASLLLGPAPEAHGNVLESSPNTNRSLRGLRPFGRIDVQAVQPLFTWGRLDAASDAATAGVEGRSLLVKDQLAQVQVRIIQLYWGEALARRILEIVADVEKALQEVDRRVDASLARADGAITQADRYRVDHFHGLVRQRKADAQRGRDFARVGLAATLALPPERLSLREAPLEVGDEGVPQAAAARAQAGRQRPDVRALDQAIAAGEASVRAEEAAALPQIFLGVTFSYAYAPNRDIQLNPWVRDEFNLLNGGLALGARQDLAFSMLRARADKARAELAGLERQRLALARLVDAQVGGALADIRGAADRLSAARATLGSGKSWFRAAGLDFSAGLVEARDLLDAYAGYVESQAWLAQAVHDLLAARARLAQATGELPKGGEQRCELQ